MSFPSLLLAGLRHSAKTQEKIVSFCALCESESPGELVREIAGALHGVSALPGPGEGIYILGNFMQVESAAHPLKNTALEGRLPNSPWNICFTGGRAGEM